MESTVSQSHSFGILPFYGHKLMTAIYCSSLFRHIAIIFPVASISTELQEEYETVRKQKLKQLPLNFITC